MHTRRAMLARTAHAFPALSAALRVERGTRERDWTPNPDEPHTAAASLLPGQYAHTDYRTYDRKLTDHRVDPRGRTVEVRDRLLPGDQVRLVAKGDTWEARAWR